MAANAAYQAMPLEGRYRVQLAVSLESLVINDKRAKLTPQAADKVSAIASSSSPNHPGVLVARAQYLMNSERWKDSDELERIASTLKAKAKTYPQTWMVEAYYHALAGRTEEAKEAILAGLSAGGKLEEMRRVANAINMEIEEK
jgi:hypothetical protein